MCRICGWYGGDVTAAELARVGGELRHGGPDATFTERGPGWALATCRLALVDPARGRQPFDHGGVIKVIFNGEIYNHVALRRALEAKGHRIPDRCDGSILPALYMEYGAGFAARLEGMFAIAVLDLRGASRLVLAVDDLGITPVYFHHDARAGRLRFASELPALRACDGVAAPPDLTRLDDYLATKTPFGEETFFAGVRVLPPGATVSLTRRGGLRVTVRGRPVAEAPSAAGLQSSARRLRRALERETCRLQRADVPVCAITSGGLDSSLVTMLAARHDPGLHTFNLAYRGTWAADERGYAVEVARRAGTHHHQVLADPAEFPARLERVVGHMGQPNADPIALSTSVLLEAIRAAGFKAALTGDAADELFGGYDRLRDALAVPDDGDWVRPYVDALAAIPRAARDRLYTPAYRDHLRDRDRTDDRLAAALAAAPGSRLDALTRIEVDQRLPAYHLRRLDHLSMAHAVEARPVFCQPRIVRIAAALPDAHRIHAGEVKRVLRRAARGIVPATVIARPKQPFTLPVAHLLRPGTPLFEHACDVLAPGELRATGLLQPVAVQRLLHAQARQPSGPAAHAIWALMIFELWRTGVSAVRGTRAVLRSAA